MSQVFGVYSKWPLKGFRVQTPYWEYNRPWYAAPISWFILTLSFGRIIILRSFGVQVPGKPVAPNFGSTLS